MVRVKPVCRRIARNITLATALTASPLAPACTTFYEARLIELPRANNTQKLTATQLGFIKGKTTFSNATRIIKSKNLTGIVKDSYHDSKDNFFQTIVADYQGQVHVFKEGRYHHSVTIPLKNLDPYGFSTLLANYKGQTALLITYRDLEGLKQPRMHLFFLEQNKFGHSASIPLGKLARSLGGIFLPYFVGRDLETGILFLGRNPKGNVWKKVPNIKFTGTKLLFNLVPLSYAAKCGCVREYIEGKKNSFSKDDFSSLDIPDAEFIPFNPF